MLQEHGISQAPVVREDSTDVSQFVGSIRDRELLERVFRDPDALQADVAEVMAPPIPTVEWDAPVEVAFGELERAPAVLVTKAGQVLGVLTRSDLLDFLAHRRTRPSPDGARARHRRRRRQGPRPRRARRRAACRSSSCPHAGLDDVRADRPRGRARRSSRSTRRRRGRRDGRVAPHRERARRLNIHAFRTPSEAHGGEPTFDWMQARHGGVRAPSTPGLPARHGPPRSGRAIEVFPHASAAVLAGCLPPKGMRKRAWRERVLRLAGVRTHDLTTLDQVDAALAALTGLLVLQGQATAFGDPAEGVIVAPDERARRRRTVRASSPAERPAGRCSAWCACGDRAQRQVPAGSEFAQRTRREAQVACCGEQVRDGREAAGGAEEATVGDAPPEDERLRFDTRAIHAGQEPDALYGAVNVPIYQTSTYAQDARRARRDVGTTRAAATPRARRSRRRSPRWRAASAGSRSRAASAPRPRCC